MKHIILNKIIICLVLSSLGQSLFAQVETSVLSEQIKACKSNTAMNWDSTLNRCVYKKQDVQTQNKVAECGKIEDKAAREKCHLNIAEEKTSLPSDTDKIYQSNTNKSMMMNASTAATAYLVVGALNKKASESAGLNVPKEAENLGTEKPAETNAVSKTADQDDATPAKESENKPNSKTCMSKQILGMTGVAGIATDVWMKMQTKKKMAELKKAYQVDLNSSAFDGQQKAFEYLLKEQETVKEMAALEKKRNLALMAGYGAALAMSVWETVKADPNCKFLD